ncbi:YihY family inner membrane protein [Erythrobacter arachoides]|uniref:YihY family inner membrane protein n=1 Tax=Aurantiacibacter arachoides TaxID=1850444 RepID=A0A845A295_9SPHN|nr:YihY/virulence factor BrkB family protein [Aurantiacibacter arachoides]MXO94661.1 YihY family inner membrane protein [Aurantiacibacter arachoides]GGD61741.1 ribonuclease [Aurantiacibacter arachoides]
MGVSPPPHADRKGASPQPRQSWFNALKIAFAEAGKDNAGIVAAGVAYYAFLAIVPLLGAMVIIYGLVADAETVAQHARTLAGVLPQAAAQLIVEQLETATTSATGTAGLGLVAALAVALFGARNGAGALIVALDIAYDLTDSRSFVKRNLLALAMTLAAIAGFVLVGGALAATGLLQSTIAKVLSYAIVFAAAMGGAWLIYRFGPDRSPPPARRQLPGAVFFAGAEAVLTLGFGLYVANFGSYDATYGSLGAVVVLLTWLYLSAYVLIIGAELNAPAEHDFARSVATT